MDELTLATIALLVTLVAIVAAASTGWAFEVHPAIMLRLRMMALRRELAAEVAAREALPPPRAHHDGAHCTKCGRFAHVVSTGEWGTLMRCRVHGAQFRLVKRIGKHEAPLVEVVVHRPLVPLALPPVTSPIELPSHGVPAMPAWYMPQPPRRRLLAVA
jgi:hypothetical protein